MKCWIHSSHGSQVDSGDKKQSPNLSPLMAVNILAAEINQYLVSCKHVFMCFSITLRNQLLRLPQAPEVILVPTVARYINTKNPLVLGRKWSPGATIACRVNRFLERSHSSSYRGRVCRGCQSRAALLRTQHLPMRQPVPWFPCTSCLLSSTPKSHGVWQQDQLMVNLKNFLPAAF